ncbi:serine/threonine-protein kinase Kin4p [[Candida] anglica]
MSQTTSTVEEVHASQRNSQATHSSVAKRVHREVRFGSYILGSTLGEGEFGKVKLGWRKDGKQPSQVAIKLIKRDSIMKDSDSEIKVHREINSLKLLNHPNIVKLVEVMKSGKYIGIVLEYASGGELFDYILHHKYLKENVAKKLFAQLVSGVDYMHSKGLIHRDLKLENLLLDKHKNVIISDFGFVNSYNKDKNDFMKTSCGSPCYAAPELVLTQSPYEGRKVDIWSLGVILYAMLSGYLPFDDDPENEDGADIVRLYHYICKTPLTFPEYVSPLARDLLRKIIVPDPKKRININDIRSHPWLTPHVNLLSIRQPEWDRIHKENKTPASITQLNSHTNKRFSMLNERTNSSALMPKRGRSMSNSNVVNQIYSNPPAPTTSSSLANAIALPLLNGTPSGSNVGENTPIRPSSPSPINGTTTGSGNYYNSGFQRGHTKSASVSNTYPTASTALKAVVTENNNNFKRNSISSINSTTSLSSTQPSYSSTSTSSKPHYQLPMNLSRSSTYTGSAISTIVESPTRAGARSPAIDVRNGASGSGSSSTAVTAAMLAVAGGNGSQRQNSDNTFIALLPSRAGGYNATREHTRLPHSEKKPRPTSYHPSSMSSTLLSSSHGSSTGLLDYITPINLPIPQFLSTSPTKSSTSTNVDSVSVTGVVADTPGSPSSGVKSGASIHSRRSSFVTPINVNGVLTSETNLSQENRNSVLCYLEDKIEALELSDRNSHNNSPTKSGSALNVTPQIDQYPDFDGQVVSPTSPEVELNAFKEPSVKSESIVNNEELSSDKKIVVKKEDKVSSSKKQDRPFERVPSRKDSKERERKEKDKENKDKENKDKETKKRNRFSILSFYSTYNSSSNNIASQAVTPSPQPVKKILEPTEMNISPPNMTAKEKKRVGSAGSSRSNTSKKSTTSTVTSTGAAGKEASAARKVMDFFKRRSVRVG